MNKAVDWLEEKEKKAKASVKTFSKEKVIARLPFGKKILDFNEKMEQRAKDPNDKVAKAYKASKAILKMGTKTGVSLAFFAASTTLAPGLAAAAGTAGAVYGIYSFCKQLNHFSKNLDEWTKQCPEKAGIVGYVKNHPMETVALAVSGASAVLGAASAVTGWSSVILEGSKNILHTDNGFLQEGISNVFDFRGGMASATSELAAKSASLGAQDAVADISSFALDVVSVTGAAQRIENKADKALLSAIDKEYNELKSKKARNLTPEESKRLVELEALRPKSHNKGTTVKEEERLDKLKSNLAEKGESVRGAYLKHAWNAVKMTGRSAAKVFGNFLTRNGKANNLEAKANNASKQAPAAVKTTQNTTSIGIHNAKSNNGMSI